MDNFISEFEIVYKNWVLWCDLGSIITILTCNLSNSTTLVYTCQLSRLRVENFDLTPAHAFGPISHAWLKNVSCCRLAWHNFFRCSGCASHFLFTCVSCDMQISYGVLCTCASADCDKTRQDKTILSYTNNIHTSFQGKKLLINAHYKKDPGCS